MCGIAGLAVCDDAAGAPWGLELQGRVERMCRALVHRGPDGQGVWRDAGGKVALGHRRLSILDLSERGAQPMLSWCGRYAVTFNGEVFNFRALRARLEGLGHAFRGTGDTEVLVAALSQWGVHEASRQLEGMFAFAAWDLVERRLHLVRDGLGKKPLYFGWLGGRVGEVLGFGSELKALGAAGFARPEVDRMALGRFVRQQCVGGDTSILQGIERVPPGCVVSFAMGPGFAGQRAQWWFWRMPEVAGQGQKAPLSGDGPTVMAKLEEALAEAVDRRMVSDVPLGAFLSGGIDSSLVVALMQAQSARAVRTFCIGFVESAYDETGHARAVARHLGCEHTEVVLESDAALGLIEKMPTVYDEPFADASQLPTYLVCQMAREHVTVALSGDGGDEFFAGYPRQTFAARWWERAHGLPPVARRALARATASLPPHLLRLAHAGLRELPGPLSRVSGLVDPHRVHLARRLAQAPLFDDLYLYLMSQWRDEDVVVGVPAGLDPWQRPVMARDLAPLEAAVYLDQVCYLPDDILVKVDRASMAVGLEVRAPLLDEQIVRLSWQVPMDLKVREGQGKWILRELLCRHVPRALVERPKMGFGVPVGQWLRGPLRPWAEALLDPGRLAREGYFHPEPVRRRWQEHLQGRRAWSPDLWSVLMFQSWLEQSRHWWPG